MPNRPLGRDSKDHEESALPLMLRLRGTVILKIWWQIVLVAIYTIVIVSFHNYVDGFRMSFPLVMVSILGVVTGLLLVFRTNTAYDRYWEGRRIWSQMTLSVRNMARSIWAGVEERPGPENVNDILEKVSAINLLVAFVFAVKNYLREEYSYDEEDMKDLISHLPRFATPSSNQSMRKQDPARKMSNFSHLNKSTASLAKKQSERGKNIEVSIRSVDSKTKGKSKSKSKGTSLNLKAQDFVTPTNIPIELSYYLTSYVNSVRERKLCDSSHIGTMNSSISSMVDCLTSFERILRTPIPLAYSVHLHHSMWLYLLALPFQLVGSLNWFTVPAVALASFALLGILSIGWEIENPFGYDENDLPLDDFCNVTRKEVQVIMGRAVPTPESWMMSKYNSPIAPVSFLNAEELSRKSVEQIRDILALQADVDVNTGLLPQGLIDDEKEHISLLIK